MSLPPFDTVVAEHGSVVYRVCRAILGPHDAEDAWSETFLSALTAYPDLRPDSDVRAWLVTVAHRKAIDVHRKAARTPTPTERLPERADVVDPPTKPDDELIRALRRLPFKQRAAVAYRYLADLGYPDIAALLGNNETAARRNAADGIAALRAGYPGAGRQGTTQLEVSTP